MKAARLVLAALVAATLGCSTAPATTPGAPTEPTATAAALMTTAPTASPAPPTPTAPPTREELAASYLACINPYNATVIDVKARLDTTRLKRFKRAMRDLSAALTKVMTCVRAIPFTPEYAADVRDYLKAAAGFQIVVLDMARVDSFADTNLYFNQYAKRSTASSAASNQLRSSLGLPPPPKV